MYGAESVILDLSRALQFAGHKSEIGVFANSASPNTELKDRATREGITAHEIPCAGQLDLGVADRLRALVKLREIDVVHAHGYKGDVYAYLSMRRSSIPLVATCHNWIDGDLALRIYGRLDRFVLKRFAGVAAVSLAVRQRLISSGVAAGSVRFIRNGVDLRPLSKMSRAKAVDANTPIRVGIVARLSPEKGVDTFLRMAALLLQDLPTAQFLVAGEGPERVTLENLIIELGLRDRAMLLGRQEDMPAFYRQLDLLVLSSRTEGLPMAILEGMASGLPVVATRVGEVPEVVKNEETGYIVEIDDPQALASAVRIALSDPEKRLTMGEAARDQVRAQYSAEQMAENYIAFYQSVQPSASSNVGRT